MNKVILSGNLTRDPEVRYTPSGTAYARMGIAVGRPYSSKNNEGQAQADFFNMTVWDKQAEFCGRYMKKGSSVIVEGRVENNNYEDKNGVKHYAVDIRVERIEFAGSNKRQNEGDSEGNYNVGKDSGTNNGVDTDDVDVPF
jgi:single-strand DNA-binding protein